MPRGDRTGPMGMGSGTGRGAGFCSGAGVPGFANPATGRGVGTGFGRHRNLRGCGGGAGGRGWRNMFNATGLPGWARYSGGVAGQGTFQADPAMETQALKNQAEALKTQLEAVNRRLTEIEPKE